MASGGFRGTSIEQDARFFNQNKKLLAKMAFPKCFDEKVDLRKVKLEVMQQWVTERVTQLLGFEDDIVASLIVNLLEPKVDEKPDPRQLQVAITGFLEKDAPAFTQELWELLLSAQAHPTGIPTQLLEKKKQELEQLAGEKEKLRQALEKKRHEASGNRGAIERGTAAAAADQPDRREAGDRDSRAAADRKETSEGDRGRRDSRDYGRREIGARDRGDRRDSRERGRRESPRRYSDRRSRDRSRSRPRRRSRSPSHRRRRRSPSSSRSKSRSASADSRRRRRVEVLTLHFVNVMFLRAQVALAFVETPQLALISGQEGVTQSEQKPSLAFSFALEITFSFGLAITFP